VTVNPQLSPKQQSDLDALKDFASETAPVVQTHLEHAQALP
jgi:hypothetical protein